ncbi:hypothetical protein D3C72_1675690 [compost metagenome]
MLDLLGGGELAVEEDLTHAALEVLLGEGPVDGFLGAGALGHQDLAEQLAGLGLLVEGGLEGRRVHRADAQEDLAEARVLKLLTQGCAQVLLGEVSRLDQDLPQLRAGSGVNLEGRLELRGAQEASAEQNLPQAGVQGFLLRLRLGHTPPFANVPSLPNPSKKAAREAIDPGRSGYQRYPTIKPLKDCAPDDKLPMLEGRAKDSKPTVRTAFVGRS